MRWQCSRAARLNSLWLGFLGSIGVLAVLLAALMFDPAWFARQDRRPLIVYCAAGLKEPVEAAAQEYEKEFGIPIRLQFGGSEYLLSNFAVTAKGDLYIPADYSYIEKARRSSPPLIDEVIPAASMRPVLAVRPGTLAGVQSIKLADLLATNLRIVQASPSAAAIGEVTRRGLGEKAWQALKARTAAEKGTVNEVANDVLIGAADVGIVWDSIVAQHASALESRELAELINIKSEAAVAVLRCCERPQQALHFARYLTARDRGLKHFQKSGFTPVPDADVWADKPRLRLMAGAMLRPAIEETVREFQEREGLPEIRCDWNGCGILVGQMQVGQVPDAFFACDASFMHQVRHLFQGQSYISSNQLVILVHKGNPHNIRDLDDLVRTYPDGKGGQRYLRIGIGNEQQCALGVLTQMELRAKNLDSQVKAMKPVEAATGDMLVNAMLANPGNLDAVVVYRSNTVPAQERFDVVPVKCVARQPLAMSKGSDHKYLIGRLFRALQSEKSRQRFEALQFKWELQSHKP